VQFIADIEGGGPTCGIHGSFNCQPGTGTYTNGLTAWFFFCLSPGADLTATMDHAIKTDGKCCSRVGSITNWSYFSFCVDENSPVDEGCFEFSFINSCPTC
jgi:hypothetical protein